MFLLIFVYVYVCSYTTVELVNFIFDTNIIYQHLNIYEQTQIKIAICFLIWGKLNLAKSQYSNIFYDFSSF